MFLTLSAGRVPQEELQAKEKRERLERARRHRKKKEEEHKKQFVQACKDIATAEKKMIESKEKERKERRRREAQAWIEKKVEGGDEALRRMPMAELVSGLSLTPRAPRKVRINRGVLKTGTDGSMQSTFECNAAIRPKSSSHVLQGSPPMRAMRK